MSSAAATAIRSSALASPNDTVRVACVGFNGRGRFMQSLETLRASGGDTMRIFFDYFYRQKTPGREDAPRRYLPDSMVQ